MKLLPGPTIRSTCEACHDGTGGEGVYGSLTAQGVPVGGAHRIDVTSSVPGGDATSGGSSSVTFTGAGGTLTCDDCHSPHGNATVAAFRGDRWRTDTDSSGYDSNRLLKKRPTSGTVDVAVYGSDWCAACHKGRVSASATVHNHPVDSEDSSPTVGSPYYYNSVPKVTAWGAATTALGMMGQSNFGYVMPYPRTTGAGGQSGHAPICQQCHEDARGVDSTDPVRDFVVTTAGGGAATDNPRFQNFPHESANPSLLVETGSDLCTNCHESGSQMP